MSSVTNAFHRTIYPSISPSQFDHSEKCVAIIGCSSAISKCIAASFAAASAKKILLVGRSIESVEDAVTAVKQQIACSPNGSTSRVEGRLCDISSPESVAAFWQGLNSEGIPIHILVLVAARINQEPVFSASGMNEIYKSFEVNVFGSLRMVGGFIAHENKDNARKVILNLSSAAVHFHNYKTTGAYATSKIAFAQVLQSHADVTSPEKLQIINYHPGAVLTDQARKHNLNEESLLWDEVDVVGGFSVWAASPVASHLHGKFLWANWDVDEMSSQRFKEKLLKDPGYLRIGLQGLHPESGADFVKTLVPVGRR